MKRTVNYYVLGDALAWLELAEFENGRPLDMHGDDEASVKRAVALFVRPEIARWSKEKQEELRLSLAYYKDQPATLRYILASLQEFNMPRPRDACLFYRWVWEALYPGQRIEDVDLVGVVEDIQFDNREDVRHAY